MHSVSRTERDLSVPSFTSEVCYIVPACHEPQISLHLMVRELHAQHEVVAQKQIFWQYTFHDMQLVCHPFLPTRDDVPGPQQHRWVGQELESNTRTRLCESINKHRTVIRSQ